ncbi:hypothetical protein [Microvirga splendida]|uniref:Uncharacterized protein n=1 Tax=Microvirga splendida TaxID=2795727 RepID=A0ABS0Y0E1_9HYPH|nr:hypothetical protein [Microvirga splendida]MBJ6125475.1 hypothetical protein [Microvirga splendida]
MSNIQVLTEECLGVVAGGKSRCDRPPGINHAELYAWSTFCANLHGGGWREWYIYGHDMLSAEQRQPKKEPKRP